MQLSIFWVVTSFLAAGIFLTPMIAGRKEPRGQHVLSYLLLGALVVVVVGSLLGELRAACHGWFGDLWSWFGMQGFEYLDLGRFWQVLLIARAGLLGRHVVARAAQPAGSSSTAANMPWLFFYAALALPAFYAVGLLVHPRVHVRGGRLLALLGRPPVGRGLPGAVHHDDGRVHVRAARRGPSSGTAMTVIFFDAILYSRRRGHRHDAPLLLQR